jgi:hypothetical protein
MDDMLGKLAARLARLEDLEAIRQLKARYLRACDLKQVEDVRSCFLPGSVRIAYQGFPIFTNRDDFVDLFREMACRGGVYDMHHATNAEIELSGEGRARGLWSLNFRTILLETSSVTHLVVEYEDAYLRQDGRWWISETESRITSFLSEEIDEAGFAHYTAWGSVPSEPDSKG